MSTRQHSEQYGREDHTLGRMLRPQSIAIIGASNTPTKLSGRPLDYLKRFAFTGRILPINKNRDSVQGLPAYSGLDQVDGDIDLAVIMLPAEQVADAVRSCGKRGIPTAIVIASGFAELGEQGAQPQRELDAAIRETGVRVLGPNCLGMIEFHDRATATFSSALDEDVRIRYGPVAFVSQSGAFGSFILSEVQQTGIGLSHYVNTGNEADLSAAEILDALVNSDQTEVLLAYLEGVSDAPRLVETARRASELDKPIIVVKVGRSAAGARAAQSHTASLAGEDVVFDGVARQCGLVRVDGMQSMVDAAQVFATGRRTRGRRLSTLSVSGGAGALMADVAAPHGIEVGVWDEKWQERMAAVIPRYGSPRNPIDLTGTLVAEPELLRRGLEVASEHPDTDMIAVLLGCADGCADELIDAIDAVYRSTDRPLVVVWTGGSGRARQRLRELGIPCYPDPGRAAAALGHLADYSLRQALSQPRRPADVDTAGARAVLSDARSEGRARLTEYESSRLIAAYGIPVAVQLPVFSADAAATALAEVGGPVAVKLLSDRIGHKSDIGGVRLGLSTPDDVRRAAEELFDAARTAGVHDAALLVQRIATGDTELIVGGKQDPTFGPVVVVGLGGVLVEVLADTRVAAAPVDDDTARAKLRSLKGAALLEGVRGAPPRDLDAAADIIVRMSWLAADLCADLDELDVNPVLLDAEGRGAVAVDALGVLATPTQDGRRTGAGETP